MGQIDTKNAAKMSDLLPSLFVIPLFTLWLIACFVRGLAVTIFNQVKNSQLHESLLIQE